MELLAERQQKILHTVVREYVQTAEPVGSNTVRDQLDVEVSPATIRNDMAALEQAGYLASPHTSAGRVPTEQAYRYYVQHLLKQASLAEAELSALRKLWRLEMEAEHRLKMTAKLIAEQSAEGVFLALGAHSLYYTGLSNLFSQPEFTSDVLRVSMAAVIDHLDDKISTLLTHLDDGVVVMVGSDNPLGSDCSIVVTRYSVPHGPQGLLGVLGPTRMDYDTNVTRLTLVHKMINHHE